MAACFVNHVFFVLPIAERIYGPLVSQPIAGIILVDVFIFCGTTVLMDVINVKVTSYRETIFKLAKNPFLVACVLGMLMWLVPWIIPNGVMTYASFVGSAAAPASLFALGIVLAGNPIRPIGSTAWIVIVSKVAFHPMLFFMLSGVAGISSPATDVSLLVAAGPCGAMPFVIALQYGVKSDGITKAIILSTLLSLITLAALTA